MASCYNFLPLCGRLELLNCLVPRTPVHCLCVRAWGDYMHGCVQAQVHTRVQKQKEDVEWPSLSCSFLFLETGARPWAASPSHPPVSGQQRQHWGCRQTRPPPALCACARIPAPVLMLVQQIPLPREPSLTHLNFTLKKLWGLQKKSLSKWVIYDSIYYIK